MHKNKLNVINSFLESIYGALTPERSKQAEQHREAYQTFRSKARAERSWIEVAADSTTAFFGSITFAVLHIVWFVVWILINTGLVAGILPFDPFPFGLLTMIVSLEAIFLSVFVLISQNRETQISDLRAEMDFHINKQTEQEVTKIVTMVHEIHEHLGLTKGRDREVEVMKQKLDPEKLAEEIQKESV